MRLSVRANMINFFQFNTCMRYNDIYSIKITQDSLTKLNNLAVAVLVPVAYFDGIIDDRNHNGIHRFQAQLGHIKPFDFFIFTFALNTLLMSEFEPLTFNIDMIKVAPPSSMSGSTVEIFSIRCLQRSHTLSSTNPRVFKKLPSTHTAINKQSVNKATFIFDLLNLDWLAFITPLHDAWHSNFKCWLLFAQF